MDGFGLRPLAGGFSGETFLADAAGEQSVVRIYGERGAARGPAAPEIDAALLRLVRGLLPVPEVLDVRRADPSAGTPGMLVTSLLPGTRLDLVLPVLDDGGRQRVGRELGALLGRLAQMPMVRAGLFLDGDLRIEPFPPGDLVDFVGSLRSGTALADWTDDDFDGLLEVADAAQSQLEEVRRTCLVHSDFNPKNLLVDEETLAVTGVLDWEYAHAGSPVTDLGNLLRFHRDPGFVDEVLSTFGDQVPDVLTQARAADLFALTDLAGRRTENPVAEQAHRLLLEVAQTGDLHAWPFEPEGAGGRGPLC
jgi:aminoglycoside phosphotransferase (APT) family kinase protein